MFYKRITRGLAARKTFLFCVIFQLLAFRTVSFAGYDEFPHIYVVSGPEIVYRYQNQRCDEIDIPDSPVRAFRRYDGKIVAFSTHYLNRRFIGSSLSDIRHDCRVVFEGRHNPDPAVFDDRTWIAATWTFDGRSVIALGHNEYQADKFPGRCLFMTYQQCWYNSIVSLKSIDGGKTFSRTDAAKALPIAASRFTNEFDQGHPRGFFDPSNIVEFNGKYYALIARRGITGEPSGRCLFRADAPEIASSWKYYNGHSFVSSSRSPYDREAIYSSCEIINVPQGTLGSIAIVRGRNLVAEFSLREDHSVEGGVVQVAFSRDFLFWSEPQIITKLSLFWSGTCSNAHRYNYVSALDDQSSGKNFDNIAGFFWLFIVRAGCQITMDRDLIRFRAHID